MPFKNETSRLAILFTQEYLRYMSRNIFTIVFQKTKGTSSVVMLGDTIKIRVHRALRKFRPVRF